MALFRVRNQQLEATRVQELGPGPLRGEIFYLVTGPSGGLAAIDANIFEALYQEDECAAAVAAPHATNVPAVAGVEDPPPATTKRKYVRRANTATSGPPEPVTLRRRPPSVATEAAPAPIHDAIRLGLGNCPAKIDDLRAFLKSRDLQFNANAVTEAMHDMVLSREVIFDSDSKIYRLAKR